MIPLVAAAGFSVPIPGPAFPPVCFIFIYIAASCFGIDKLRALL